MAEKEKKAPKTTAVEAPTAAERDNLFGDDPALDLGLAAPQADVMPERAYQGLARKWRPQTFEDLVGQEGVADSLRRALGGGKVAQCHLLTGPRGVGKTTTARIVAKAVNCEKGPTTKPCGVCAHCRQIALGTDLNVEEIDAASNNGIEFVRELRERIQQMPFSARYRVYIMDEVHMLSIAAFNGLLKTLEEPPAHVIFLLATTELDKIPETIRSRCTHHAFRRLTADDIARRLAQVAEGEGLIAPPEVAREVFGLIARASEGGMRDALVSLDQVLAMNDGRLDAESAIKLLGLSDRATILRTVAMLNSGDVPGLLDLIEEQVDKGRNLERYVKELVAHLRDLMLLQAGAKDSLVAMGGEALEEARRQAKDIPRAALFNMLNQMFELEEKLKRSAQARFLIEFAFLRVAQIRPVVPLDEIMRRLRAVPDETLGGGSGGGAMPPSPPSQPSPVRRAPMQNTQPNAAMFNDSAPPAEASVAEAAPARYGSGLAGVERGDLLRRWMVELPDALQFIRRYLDQAADFVIENSVMRILWPGDAVLSVKRVEHADVLPLLEAALGRLHGSPLKIRNDLGAAPAARMESPKAAPRRANSALPSGPPRAPMSAPTMAESAPRAAAVHAAPREHEREQSGADAVQETREAKAPAKAPAMSPMQRARALMENDDFARRVRMIKDMFNGRYIDEDGAALPM